MKSEGEQAVDEIAADIAMMRPEMRLEVLAAMRAVFCLHCGEDHPLHHVCQCDNDE